MAKGSLTSPNWLQMPSVPVDGRPAGANIIIIFFDERRNLRQAQSVLAAYLARFSAFFSGSLGGIQAGLIDSYRWR